MEAALRLLLPRLLSDLMSFEIYPSQCKAQLLKELPNRLRGYSKWLPADWRIVVVVNRDDDDCFALKRLLDDAAREAGLRIRTAGGVGDYQVVSRLAIEELEAWYFGDWEAVRMAYPRVPDSIPRQAPYRDPDSIRGGTWEAFERILQRAGYFGGGLRKIEAARTVAERWDPGANRSRSFMALRDALQEMAT